MEKPTALNQNQPNTAEQEHDSESAERAYLDKIQKLYQQNHGLRSEQRCALALELGMTEERWEQLEQNFEQKRQEGYSFLKQEDWEKAILSFEEALLINPWCPRLLFAKTEAHLGKYQSTVEKEDLQAAVFYAEKCLLCDPSHVHATNFIQEYKPTLYQERDQRWKLAKQSAYWLAFVGIFVLTYFFVWQPITHELQTDWVKIKELLHLNEPATFTLYNLNFAPNEVTLDATARRELDRLANYLQEHPEVKGEIAGHTDNTGEPEVNQRISELRAKSVYEYLLQKEIDAQRLRYQGYGSSKPLANNDNPEHRRQNRRIEFKILP